MGFSGFEARRYHVFCEKGSFGLDPAFSYNGLAAHVIRDGKRDQLRIEPTNHFAAEMDYFSSCVTKNFVPATSGEEGLRDMKILARIEEAVECRAIVKV